MPLLLSDDYIPCTEEGLFGNAPTINLGDHGGTLIIASPMYPYHYTDNSNCHWDFVSSDPSKAVQIRKLDWVVSRKELSLTCIS